MTDAINEINNARNFLKGKFEIVRHIIDDLYVIKYPATLMHQRIFESFRVGKRAFNDFVIPKRKELMINKIYLVKQPSGIFSRVVIISFKNEVLLRIWFIDEDKYATVTLDKLRIADGFDELYPIYRPYILEIKVEALEPTRAFVHLRSTKEKKDKPICDSPYSNSDFRPFSSSNVTKSPSENETNIKPEKHVDLDFSFSSTENKPAMENFELHTALDSSILLSVNNDEARGDNIQNDSPMGSFSSLSSLDFERKIQNQEIIQLEYVSTLSASTSFSSLFLDENGGEIADISETRSSSTWDLSMISSIHPIDVNTFEEIIAIFKQESDTIVAAEKKIKKADQYNPSTDKNNVANSGQQMIRPRRSRFYN